MSNSEEPNYLSVLINSDPRVPFESLHFGALLTMEERSGPSRSTNSTALLRRFPSATKPDAIGDGKEARFVFPAFQSLLDARLPQPCEVAGALQFLQQCNTEMECAALGPALAHAVREYHPKLRRVAAKRRRRRTSSGVRQVEMAEETNQTDTVEVKERDDVREEEREGEGGNEDEEDEEEEEEEEEEDEERDDDVDDDDDD